MQSSARVAERTTPDVFREVAAIAQGTEEFVSTTSLGEDNRRLLAIVQRDVHDVRGEHSAIFEAHPSDLRPTKRLIPLRLKIFKNTDADFGIIELHREDFVERFPAA